MSPEAWLHKILESAAECKAYPAYVPRTAEVPFVYFSRTATEREHAMDGDVCLPVATIQVVIFADTYLQTKSLATRIRAGVDNFSGDAGEITIHQARVVDERDSDPEFFVGEDVPTYSVEMTLDIRFSG